MKSWKILLPVLTAAILGGPATASASGGDVTGGLGSTNASSLDCVDPVVENPFVGFGDNLDYVLAPNGSFESAGGWQFADGAGTAAGDDPFDLRSGTDETLLSLPEGSSATSGLMCVDPSYPTFRFPVNVNDRRGTIRVEVSYPSSKAGDRFRRSDSFKLSGGDGWTLSPHLDLDPVRGGDGPGWRPMAIRLIAKDGDFQLDDVYVDPRLKG